MLYARQDDTTLIVSAADTFEAFEAFSSRTLIDGQGTQPDAIEMMMDDRFSGFRFPPLLIEFASPEDLSSFATQNGITLVKPNRLRYLHDAMVDAVAPDPLTSDTRTIAEIYGIDEVDPWDERTDEEIERDKKVQEAIETAKKEGKLTGDSFKGTKVTDVKTRVKEDGSIEIASAIAHKGGKKALEPEKHYRLENVPVPVLDRLCAFLGVVSREGELIEAKADINRLVSSLEKHGHAYKVTTIDPQTGTEEPFVHDEEAGKAILTGGMSVYHRIDLVGIDLEEAKARLASHALTLEKVAIARGETKDGCWMASISPRLAERMLPAFEGVPSALYGVNPDGLRILAEDAGATLVDGEKETPPRPWNDKAPEFDAMSADERAECLKGVEGSEFCFAGHYNGPQHGTIIYIQPKEFFNTKTELWKESLPIAKLLPSDIVEIEPCVYHTKSRNYEQVINDLSRRGFDENLFLRLFINNLD